MKPTHPNPVIRKLLNLAKLLAQERAITKKADEIRNKIRAIKPEYRSAGHSSNGITLSVELPTYLALVSDPKPVAHDFDAYRRLHYPPVWLGRFAEGEKHLWIEAWSEKFDQKPAETPAAA